VLCDEEFSISYQEILSFISSHHNNMCISYIPRPLTPHLSNEVNCNGDIVLLAHPLSVQIVTEGGYWVNSGSTDLSLSNTFIFFSDPNVFGNSPCALLFKTVASALCCGTFLLNYSSFAIHVTCIFYFHN
jgi:hypothetical protein